MQGEVEKFIIQAIQGGVDIDKLKSFFAPHLENLNEELADIVKKVLIYFFLSLNTLFSHLFIYLFYSILSYFSQFIYLFFMSR